jgi:NAD(P)-dependent dehydrogenase (short-subunit alcohol dehydrogenase family)
MGERLDGQVVVVGGGDAGVGAAVTRALAGAGARVVVPVPTEEDAERFYLEADPATVPRLRTATGPAHDPATLARIAAVARREFGGIDHLVAAFRGPSGGGLDALDADAAQEALRGHAVAPGLFVLGLLRHLTGSAPVKRVVMLSAPPQARHGVEALGHAFAAALAGVLREHARAGIEPLVLALPATGAADSGARSAGEAVVRLLAHGAAGAGGGASG